VAIATSWSGSIRCNAQGYVIVDIGSLYGNISGGIAINNLGWVAGQSPNQNQHTRPVLYSYGTLKDLGTLGGTYGIAQGVNDNGLVVGYSADSSGNFRAFLWNGTTLADLGDLGGSRSWATSI